MDIKNLLLLLNTQQNNLNALLEAAIQKQKALVDYENKLLEDAIIKEEKALAQVNFFEKNRIKLLTEIYLQLGIKNNSFRLDEFISLTKEIIDEKSLAFVKRFETEIKNIVIKISEVNKQNIFLVEHSRAFIKEIVKAIANSQKSLLDKRV